MPKLGAQGRLPSNPFEFGGELKAAHLVDREDELEAVIRTAEDGGKLFLIGPRRYGKTSILARAEADLAKSGVVVLRYDAEVYESISLLAAALMSGAAKKLTSTLEKAGEMAKRLLSRLKPNVAYDLTEGKIEVSFGIESADPAKALPVLIDVLDAIERMAQESGKRTVVIIDEFQQIVQDGGETAERQIRGTIQRHHHVGYVFAGSKTRLLADMTNDPARAFWKLGSRYFLGPVPRQDFTNFLRRGFEKSNFSVDHAALERILMLAEEVPYNVQQLANMAWETVRTGAGTKLTEAIVDRALARILARESPSYAQLWNSLTRVQKVVLKAVIKEEGRNLRAASVLAKYEIPSATMTKALHALDEKGIVREEETSAVIRYRLEDPFLGAWLLAAQGT